MSVLGPAGMNQILLGLSLMGAKTQDQADRYKSAISQSLLDQAQWKRGAADRKMDRAYKQSVINLNKAKTKSEGTPEVNPLFSGKSMSANAANVLSTLHAKKQAGGILSAEEQTAYEIASQYLTRDQYVNTAGGDTIRYPGMDLPFLAQATPVIPIAPAETTQIPETPGYDVIDKKTPTGVKKVDEEFAKEYADWTTKGFADAEKGIIQLNAALADLESGKTTTGGIEAAADVVVPDAVMGFIAPDYVNTKDQIEEVVQRNLRLILGAQFTEKEGARLIARAYNPSLPNEQNIARVSRLRDQIAAAAKAKQEAAAYFAENKTLDGFQGKIYSAADFDPDVLFAEDVDEEYEALKRELLQ